MERRQHYLLASLAKMKGMGDAVPGLELFPKPWLKCLTDAGHSYYWNKDTNETSWKPPI